MIAKMKMTVLAAAASLCLGLPTMAQKTDAAILLNFGAEVSNDNNSPAHVHGGVAGTTWNLINSAAGLSSGVVTDTGTATNLTVTVGQETSAGTTVWTTTDKLLFAGLGSTFNTGIYAGNARSAMYGNGNVAVGVRVSGLEAGIYDVYHAGRNTNTSGGQSHRSIVFAINSSEGDTTTYSTTAGLVMSNTDHADAWVEGDNFLVTTVELGANQDLVLINRGPSSRGFLGIMEIVAVPEPTGVAMFALGGMALAFRRRRIA